MSDIGKFGKVKGDLHPKHARRIDAAPPRATPKMVRRPKAQKCFGFSYEWESLVFRKLPEGGSRSYGRKWVTEECWYETREQRDQALKAHEHKHDRRFYRNYRPIERTAVRVDDRP